MLTLRFSGTLQSEMLLSNPSHLVLTYTRVMTAFRLFCPHPRSIVMIGLGGGSLAKWCYESLPDARLRVIEISPDVIELRSLFHIPADDDRLQILLGDGAKYVARTSDRPDVLLIDGFDFKGLFPRQTGTQAFYDNCFRTLGENGVLVVNVTGNRPDLIQRIRRSFAGRVLIATPADGDNRIIFAVKGAVRPAENQTLPSLARWFQEECSAGWVHLER